MDQQNQSTSSGIVTGVLLPLGPLSWQSKEMYVCMLTHIYAHIYKYFSV